VVFVVPFPPCLGARKREGRARNGGAEQAGGTASLHDGKRASCCPLAPLCYDVCRKITTYLAEVILHQCEQVQHRISIAVKITSHWLCTTDPG
jgi:hypothetical protein